MRKLLFSTAAILSLGLAVPAAAQQSGSTQPQQSGSNQPMATQTQQSMQEQDLSKNEIRQVQQTLDQKGFKAGQADGILGPETKNAIKEFQQKQGFNATVQNTCPAELGSVSASGKPLAHQLSPAPPSPRAFRPFIRARWLVGCCWRCRCGLLRRSQRFLQGHAAHLAELFG